MMTNKSIGLFIPTYQAAKHLKQCLEPLLQSPLKPRILIIDSSSTDGTVSIAQSMGIETMTIPKASFNHGATRELGRRRLATDIVVMMTQDAYPVSSSLLDTLVKPLLKGQASIAYARQIPHQGAGLIASFSRSFNYPEVSEIRSLADLKEYGPYTFFCSNSCAAYLNSALDEVGGFPHVIFGEDTIVTAKLLQKGHRIAYEAEAVVQHSHDFTLKQEFSRHYEMGMARQSQKELLMIGGSDSQRGKAFVKALLKNLVKNNPLLIPYAVAHCGAKYLGYRLGQQSKRS